MDYSCTSLLSVRADSSGVFVCFWITDGYGNDFCPLANYGCRPAQQFRIDARDLGDECEFQSQEQRF